MGSDPRRLSIHMLSTVILLVASALELPTYHGMERGGAIFTLVSSCPKDKINTSLESTCTPHVSSS